LKFVTTTTTISFAINFIFYYYKEETKFSFFPYQLGDSEMILSECEVIRVAVEIMDKIGQNMDYYISLNHRVRIILYNNRI
jgi:hypothetical protein